MQVNRSWVALAVALVVVGSAWLIHRAYQSGETGQFATGDNANWSLLGAGKNAPDAKTPGAEVPLGSPAAVRDKLFKQGSFAGTELDGNWSVVDGKLVPALALRLRFENYLLGLGEVTQEEIRMLVQDDARRDVGNQAAADIMAIWDKYMALRAHPFQQPFKQNDRATWSPFFDEARMVRRQILGKAWAEAFFAEEEAEFTRYLAKLESGRPGAPDPGAPVPQMAPGKDPAALRAERAALYGEAAAQRLEQADTEWADWERRLAAGKTEWERLQKSSELSAPQQQDAMNRYIQAHFKADEVRRVRALLNLP